MGKEHRVSRLLEIVTLLQSGSGWNAAALAERFGVSRTRVFHDIRAIREAGIPVRSSRGGYSIAPSFFLPSVRLRPQEVLALLFPVEVFTSGPEGEEVRRSAQAKLLSCLPETLRRAADELLRRTSVLLPASRERDEIFAMLREAVVERRRIRIVYSGHDTGRIEERDIDPYGLAFRKHAWYLVAYSAAHLTVRTFRVSRIAAIEATRLHFTVPDDFSLDRHFEGAWYVFSGRPQEIGLRFSPGVAQLVRERPPHPGQQIQTLSDGSVSYRAVVNNLDEVAWWLVQYGGDAYVVYPDELRQRVVALAAAVLERHGIPVPRGRPAYELPGDARADRVAEPGEPPWGKS